MVILHRSATIFATNFLAFHSHQKFLLVPFREVFHILITFLSKLVAQRKPSTTFNFKTCFLYIIKKCVTFFTQRRPASWAGQPRSDEANLCKAPPAPDTGWRCWCSCKLLCWYAKQCGSLYVPMVTLSLLCKYAMINHVSGQNHCSNINRVFVCVHACARAPQIDTSPLECDSLAVSNDTAATFKPSV